MGAMSELVEMQLNFPADQITAIKSLDPGMGRPIEGCQDTGRRC